MREERMEIVNSETVRLPTPFRLDGKVALVTGAASERGIGRAIGRAYAAAGASVGLADLDVDGAKAAAHEVEESGGKAMPLRMDVTDPESVSEAVGELEGSFGPVDVLVNNAGISRRTRIWELSLQEFDKVMNINVRGGFLCLQTVLPAMMRRRAGSIVWVSSQAGRQGGGVFGSSHYAASKAAVIGLCQGVARELGPYRIRSNAIAPGLVETGIVAQSSSAELEERLHTLVRETTPLGRVGLPEDIANAALYLASDASAYVTGVVLDINGGAYFA